ncbi:MAG: DUF6599 family protein [Planctomycetota bacterium]
MAEGVPFPVGRLPLKIDGWRATGADRTYEGRELFDYIDGGAEPYLYYGFRRAFVRRYERGSQPAVVLDLFEMGTSQNAFGIFSFEREGDDVGYGQGSEYAAGLLRFWQGPFFVSIWAEGETPETRRAVFRLAEEVDRAVVGTGPRPDLLDRLPAEGLIWKRVRYLRHAALLNYHYYVADANLLRLREGTEAVLASYGAEGTNMRLLLIRYPAAEEAAGALADFLAAYAPEAAAGAVRTENGRWTLAQGFGSYVAIAFDAPARARAQSLLEGVRAKVEERP